MRGDEGTAFFIGAVIGIVFASCFIAFGILGHEQEACEREHNVFRCERIYVPAEPEAEA